jgi:hypothetical protein
MYCAQLRALLSSRIVQRTDSSWSDDVSTSRSFETPTVQEMHMRNNGIWKEMNEKKTKERNKQKKG